MDHKARLARESSTTNACLVLHPLHRGHRPKHLLFPAQIPLPAISNQINHLLKFKLSGYIMPEPLPSFGNIHFAGKSRHSQEGASKVIIPKLNNHENPIAYCSTSWARKDNSWAIWMGGFESKLVERTPWRMDAHSRAKSRSGLMLELRTSTEAATGMPTRIGRRCGNHSRRVELTSASYSEFKDSSRPPP